MVAGLVIVTCPYVLVINPLLPRIRFVAGVPLEIFVPAVDDVKLLLETTQSAEAAVRFIAVPAAPPPMNLQSFTEILPAEYTSPLAALLP